MTMKTFLLKIATVMLICVVVFGLAGCTGKQGPKGDMGLQGEQGPQGLQGPQGDAGSAPGMWRKLAVTSIDSYAGYYLYFDLDVDVTASASDKIVHVWVTQDMQNPFNTRSVRLSFPTGVGMVSGMANTNTSYVSYLYGHNSTETRLEIDYSQFAGGTQNMDNMTTRNLKIVAYEQLL